MACMVDKQAPVGLCTRFKAGELYCYGILEVMQLLSISSRHSMSI